MKDYEDGVVQFSQLFSLVRNMWGPVGEREYDDDQALLCTKCGARWVEEDNAMGHCPNGCHQATPRLPLKKSETRLALTRAGVNMEIITGYVEGKISEAEVFHFCDSALEQAGIHL